MQLPVDFETLRQFYRRLQECGESLILIRESYVNDGSGHELNEGTFLATGEVIAPDGEVYFFSNSPLDIPSKEQKAIEVVEYFGELLELVAALGVVQN